MTRHRRPETAQFIEFDGMQLEIRSEIVEVNELVKTVFEHMLVPASVKSAGVIRVMESESGYVVASAEETPFQHDQLENLLELVRDEVRLQFTRARPDLLWLHAAAVERNGVALLLSGPSGQGKSTLSTRLCERGWRLLSDDISPTSMNADIVFPFPQAPRRRVFPGAVIDRHKLHILRREEVSVESHEVSCAPVQVGAIAYIEFGVTELTTVEKLAPGAASIELLRNAINFNDHRDAAVSKAASVGSRIPAYKLCYRNVTAAVDQLERLL